VEIKIFNVAGQLVKTLELGHREAGYYLRKEQSAHWDGRNNLGESVASGVYFYTINAGNFAATRRLVILK
jgi:flagellar hook assembly protein FlgD